MTTIPNAIFWLMVAGDIVGAVASIGAFVALWQINKGGM